MPIRRATATDMAAIASLHIAVRRACLPYLPECHTADEVAAYFAGPVYATCEVWLAEANGLLGFVAFRSGWVDHLYVTPAAQERGVGSALLRLVTDRGAPFSLFAFQRNRQALRFYLARGLDAVEHTDGAGNEEREPDTRLRWTGTASSPLALIRPTAETLPSFIAAMLAGWSPSTERDVTAAQLAEIAADRDGYLARLNGAPGVVTLADGTAVPRLPGQVLWMWDGAFCGSINLRHLPGTEALPAHVSGHIGYSVVPWKRRRGYATQALAQMLPWARAVGLSRVLLTCDPDNAPSRRVIEANGGAPAEAEPDGEGKLRFWVPTAPQ